MVSRPQLAWLLLLCPTAWAAPGLPRDPFPDAATSYVVEIDNEPAWERQPHRRLPPASLTKLMTALLVVEQDRPEAIATISRAAAHETSTRIGIKPGERFRVHDLLAAALMASAADACRALADADAGSEARFVRRMNRRARQLGMRDTHFANACGRDAANHYSSAHDLVLLAHELLRHPEIAALTSQRGARIATLDGKRSFSFDNRNALIGRYRGALGLKTGYTRRAGRCQVVYAERDGHRVLLAMLHGRNWGDATDMLDLAFDQAQHPG